MSISFACPKCGKSYKVADQLAGKSANCKQCGERMRVPEATAASDEPDLSALLPTEGAINEEAAPMREAPTPRPRGAAATTNSDSSQPGRSFSLSPMAIRVALAAVFVGLLVTVLIWRPWNYQSELPQGTDPGHYGSYPADRPPCRAHFTKIAKALGDYADKHNGKFPPDLRALLKEASSLRAEDFVCPTTEKKPPGSSGEAAADWVSKNADYAYIGGLSRDATPEKILLYEKWHRDENEILHVLNTKLDIREESMPSFKQTLSAQQSGK